MPKSEVEKLAESYTALGESRRLLAFKALNEGTSPEDAYLEHVCGFTKPILFCILPWFKTPIRFIPNYEKFYRQLTYWVPKIDMPTPTSWLTFQAFYEPFVEACVMDKDYELTEFGKQFYQNSPKDNLK